MAALTHAESKKLYSWWWASHISPKNSKWLQENLTDIDTKVKAMIKLIEEDADSFARKAEMYYKKRPELIKLVEEFYRAYRALAERYDHATGALRQTHKTMAEAFPNQIPFSLFDEPPGSYTSEGAPNMLDMLPSARAMLDYDESQKDTSNVSSPYLGIKRSGAYEDRNNKGLKQFNDLLGSGEDKLLAKSPGRMIRQEDVSELSKENQHLKSQITSESARADTAEAQVHRLKETISKMTSEKEAVIRKSLSHSKENCEKLNREILMITEQLKSAEERHLLLEKSNTDVQLELDSIKQRAYEKQEELTKLQEELERLRCSLEEEHLQFLQAEAARLSAEKLHSQSQEEIRLLTRENQTGIEKLKDIEQRKLDIEEELHKLKIENGVLNEQHHASALEIINLQGVILLLRDSKSKLEEEIGIHVDEKKGLLQELARIKEDKNNLERSCHQLTEQIETVNFNLEALQVSVKELQTGNEELKEICLRHENEKLLCLENMKGMEKIAEKNVILESSLSDANAEIEGLREKIKTLEELRESLSGNVTIHTSEKAVLISQVETLFQDMQKLSERNIFLENSLQDETSEIEILNRKMKALEESYQILSAQSSDLHSEKSALASQVEETLQSLENLEVSYTELELKHLNSGVEKDLALQQIMELEDSLKREKEEYETLILSIMLSRKSQLSSLEDQIYLLQEEGQLMKEEFEKEQQRVMDSQFENFILQRCLIDMNDKNSIISEECQKLVEASNSAEKLISELNRTVLAEEKKLASLTGSNEKLREGIWLMIREICHNNHGVPLDDTDDDSLLQLTLHEIRGLLKSFTDTLDENQHLLIEKSILVIILEQFGLNMADQTMREKALENVTESKTKELLLLQSKELELLAASEQLKTDLQVGNGRQEAQKSEMEVLFRQLRVLQEAHDTVQSENLNLLEEIQYMSKTSVDLREKMENLEEENSVILEEAMALETLFVIFKNSTIEKTTESQLMMKDLACLRGVTDGLDRDITLLMEELLATEFENVYLKETVASLGECQRLFTVMEDDLSATRNVAKQFDLEIESGKALLAQKDSELFQANQTLSSTQSKNTDLRMTVEGLQLDINGALVQREELENTIFKLSENNEYMNNEISFLRLENGRLNEELDRLHKVVECLRSREEHLNSDLRKYVDEVNACETEIEMLMNDIQTRTVEAEVYEGKVLELLLTCENLEISAMVQKEMLYDEIARRTAIVDETKEKVDTTERENICLKEELNAYLLLETALWNDATSLEEQILYLASHCTSNLQETTDNQVASLHHLESNHEPSETMETGILGLQKLHAKIQGLQKVVIDTGVLLEQEMVRSNASLKAAVEDIEVLESKGNSGQKEMQISEGIVQQENSQEGLRDNKLPNLDAQNSMTNSEQMMKDIPLDHVSPRREDGFHSYRSSLSENAGINDQDLIMWEQMESNSRNQSQKASSSLAWDDNESQQGSVIGVGRKKDTSEIVPVKVVSIDTQKLRKKNADSHREHDIKVIGGLSSDAQRLSVLQTSVEELKKKMETSEMNESPRSFEFDTIKAQLKEAEASISQLIDTNSKLKKKAEEFFDSFAVAGYSEMQSNRRQNSERARKISEKVGRLELELHKIQYILSKLTEEHEFKKDRAANRRRVMLKDYLYGRMDNRRRRRILCCMRPKTWED